MTEQEQIEEMARIISEYDECGNCKVCKYHNCCSSEYHATNLYNEGYRKQVEGEWTGSWDFKCSICNEYNEYGTAYCPHCGAHMKGGE